MHEATEDGATLARVRHLRMELHAVEFATFVGHSRDRSGLVARDHLEAGGERRDLVAVAHPHVEQAVLLAVDAVLDAFEQSGMAAGADLGIAEFAHPGILDLAAELSRHGLHAVADPERDPELEDGLGGLGRGVVVHGGGPPGEHDAARGEAADEFLVDVEGMQLAVDLRLPDAARDQLRVLRAEVEDEDLVVHYSTW